MRNKLNLENVTMALLVLFAATSSASISLMQSAYGMASVCWLGVILWTRAEKGWHASGLLEPMLAFVLANFVAVIFSVDPLTSLRGIRQLSLMGMVLVVGNTVTTKRQAGIVILTWLAAATVMSLYAIGQYLNGLLRVKALFDGPMTLVRILVLVSSVTITLSVCARGRTRYVSIFGSIATTTALVLTFARGAWLALGAALVLLGVLLRNKIIFVSLAIIVCLALILVAFYPETEAGGLVRSIVHPLDASSARFYKSNLQRYWMWRSALRIFPDYPITGVGQRNFSKVYPDYVPKALRDSRFLRDDGRVYTGFAHAHNLYLNLLVTQGLLGLTCFLWLVITAMRLAYQSYRRQEDAFLKNVSLAILAAIVAFLALGVFDENFRDSEGIIQIWFLMGLVFAIHRITPAMRAPCDGPAAPRQPST